MYNCLDILVKGIQNFRILKEILVSWKNRISNVIFKGVNLKIPLFVAAMPLLCHLHLRGNFFSSHIPSEYGTWQHLALSGNELANNIAPELGNLSALRELYIGYYNIYSDGILPEIGNLSNLVRLDAAYCGLSSGILMKLGKLQNLDTLFLQVNVLSDSLTPKLGSLKSLKSMDLSNNMLFGEFCGAKESDSVELVSEQFLSLLESYRL